MNTSSPSALIADPCFPALTVFQQVGLHFDARRSKLRLEHLRHRGAKDVAVARVLFRQRFHIAGDTRRVKRCRGLGSRFRRSVHATRITDASDCVIKDCCCVAAV